MVYLVPAGRGGGGKKPVPGAEEGLTALLRLFNRRERIPMALLRGGGVFQMATRLSLLAGEKGQLMLIFAEGKKRGETHPSTETKGQAGALFSLYKRKERNDRSQV